MHVSSNAAFGNRFQAEPTEYPCYTQVSQVWLYAQNFSKKKLRWLFCFSLTQWPREALLTSISASFIMKLLPVTTACLELQLCIVDNGIPRNSTALIKDVTLVPQERSGHTLTMFQMKTQICLFHFVL
jgi:hypothetical protein